MATASSHKFVLFRATDIARHYRAYRPEEKPPPPPPRYWCFFGQIIGVTNRILLDVVDPEGTIVELGLFFMGEDGAFDFSLGQPGNTIAVLYLSVPRDDARCRRSLGRPRTTWNLAFKLRRRPGQRYSVVVNASQPVDNYWVRIRSIPNFGDQSFTNGVNSAILRCVCKYSPAGTFPGGADVNINLNFDWDFATLRHTLNGNTFSPPNAPALLQILSGTQEASDLLPTGSYIPLPPNKVIEVTIPGSSDPAAPHPFHLHGHNFFVVRSANSSEYNYIHPVIRAVVHTGFSGDNVTFRFVTDNLDLSHIDLHLEIGLAVIFAEDVEGTRRDLNPVPADWNNLCPTFDSLDPS
ncbi:Laccase 3 [Mycena kentingensis (nom. inval.)]|nr:Laccase 3 [Mycena kentingensis (nom. inval.)]